MLQMLQQIASEGNLRVDRLYLGHLKKDEERKLLAHADALQWDELEPSLRALLEQHLHQALQGPPGEVNFPCMYTGELLSVAKVASDELDRTRNRPAVEILEAIRDLNDARPEALVELGNLLAYKVMAAGAIRNQLLCLLRFTVVPTLNAAPVPFLFACLVDLDDREEALFDERTGRFITQQLTNVVKRGGLSRGALFPCLDDAGKESADLLIYAGSGAAAWFRALEATRRLNPRREGQALLRMITQQAEGTEVPHDLFRQMGDQLAPHAADGLHATAVAESLERAVGHGIDHKQFEAGWESSFGDLGYRPAFESLFGVPEAGKPATMKMETGGIQITLTPRHLEQFRQVTVDGQTFIVFAVPEKAKVVAGKELDLRIRAVSLEQLRAWLTGEAG